MNSLLCAHLALLVCGALTVPVDKNPVGDFAQLHPQMANVLIMEARADTFAADEDGLKPHEQDIPKIVHQVWYGSPAIYDASRAQDWWEIAQRFGYSYHLWTEDDDPLVATLFGQETLDYLVTLRGRKLYAAASDVLRYHLIATLGGMYFDNDVQGPRVDGQLVDPAMVWPMRGLVLVGESDTREVGNSAFFVVNAIIMAPARNPSMVALAESLLPNYKVQRDTFASLPMGPFFLTGQGLMTATMRGQFTFLANSYMEHLGIHFWPDRIPYQKALEAAYARQGRKQDHLSSIHITR